MKISIIMPIYNGENYIKKSISALLSQAYKDIELILINDGSSDESLNICKYFSEKDDRIILIDKKNQGISSARNDGINKATGEYISFIDQDDEISPNIYDSFFENLHSNPDMLIAGKNMLLIDNNGKVLKDIKYVYSSKLITEKKEILDIMLNTNRDSSSLHLWNCLYRASIIKRYDLNFNCELKFGHEDTLFNIKYLEHCRSIQMIPDIVYKYYRRCSTSTSLKSNEKYINDFAIFIKESREAYNSIKESNSSDEIFYLYCFRLGISLFAQYGRNKDKEIQIQDFVKIMDCIEKLFDYRVKIRITDRNLYYKYICLIVYMVRVRSYKIAIFLVDIIK